MSNGNYVVDSANWNGKRGAVTWGNGNTGIRGIVSATNSLVGSNPGDEVGGSNPNTFVFGVGVTPLSNGNYVVESPSWNGKRGAATWANGNTGVSGVLSEANSLVGSHTGDEVPFYVIPLSNGNYIVESPFWQDGRGAATWGNARTGVAGTVSAANSLVGSHPGDLVGAYADSYYSNIIPLSNGNYVVGSPNWNSERGAATWGDGSTGVRGIVFATNSLVGSNPGDVNFDTYKEDSIGSWITPLSNGNYVVPSSLWNGTRGAVTWGNGNTGISGTVSVANSLIGSNPKDYVGSGLYADDGITPLSNGNFVVTSSSWNSNRGAITWVNGSTGVSDTLSDANSLVGSSPNDQVGLFGVTPLSNGNYVVDSPFWDGGSVNGRGAATWGNGSTAISGTVSEANSLVGSNLSDRVGLYGIIPLSNGNYIVQSPDWNRTRGAVTWGNGSEGVSGTVSDGNSLVGSNPGDQVGILNEYHPLSGIVPLSNSNYVVLSAGWNGTRGAATWVNGTSGQTLDALGTITPQNSLVGSAANAGLGDVLENPTDQTFLAPFTTDGGGRVTASFTDPSQLTYSSAQDQSLTITSAFLARTLETGTAVVLQASNDITVNSPIQVGAGGKNGTLTLQAGRSIVLNAPITTDNGPLTLIANDELANGVVDSQRDPGNAVISMAPGTSLDTGSNSLAVELRDGAGLSHPESGAISLQTVTAGSVSVINNGPSADSDVDLGTVTTSGPQSYADPHGTTMVTGNLTTAGNPITFKDSVIVNDGVTVDAGASAVYFAGSGTQTLQSGSGSRFGNVNHSGPGTLQLSSGLTVTGTFIQSSGTFDANDQPVIVAGPASVAAGTSYLAGTAPQTFTGGLELASTFTSSSGPMTVSGPIAILGGHLNGEGVVGPVTALSGTVAPGGTSPGILSVAGSVTLFSAATVSIRCAGPMPGSDYSQLQASGPIFLGNSSLNLILGFDPPVGSGFEILTNTGSGPILGTFKGLDEGTVFSQGSYQFQITYLGGSGGNSVVLTRLA